MRNRYTPIFVVLALLALPALGFAASKPAGDEKSNPISPQMHVDFHSFADIPESEPNGSCTSANFLGCGNTLRPAAISPAGDNDWVYFDAVAGQTLTIATDADGPTGQVGDTYIYLMASDCTTILAQDDDSGPGFYSLISFCNAPYTGRYYVRVRAFLTTQSGGYKMSVSCTTPPTNDRCERPTPIQCGDFSISGSTGCATNDYTLPNNATSCTGFSADGRDLVYLLSVAAGDNISLSYTNVADGSIYIISDCTNPVATCVAGADATLSGQAEVINYTFVTTGLFYLIVDSYGLNTGGPFILNGTLDCHVVPTKAVTWGRVKTIYR